MKCHNYDAEIGNIKICGRKLEQIAEIRIIVPVVFSVLVFVLASCGYSADSSLKETSTTKVEEITDENI